MQADSVLDLGKVCDRLWPRIKRGTKIKERIFFLYLLGGGLVVEGSIYDRYITGSNRIDCFSITSFLTFYSTNNIARLTTKRNLVGRIVFIFNTKISFLSQIWSLSIEYASLLILPGTTQWMCLHFFNPMSQFD